MKIELFDFNLPDELIAQHPMEKRDHSRLFVIDRKTDERRHKHFYDIVDELTENDVLVMNNTKVIPARLIGEKEDTKAGIEVLLLKEIKPGVWEALTKPAKRIKVGTVVSFGNGLLKMQCIEEREEGIRVYQAIYEGIFLEVLDKLGTMPLPPYITEKLTDQSRYQTVYAANPGSAAAPTAGLHFTKELLQKIKEKGVEIIEVTLHVGLGTFRPVQVDDTNQHHMHNESYEITEYAAERLNLAVKNKKNIVAVGTTSVRTLESNYHNGFTAGHFDTAIFIHPGYKFKAVGSIITNFHLPKSTLIMLISAFYDREKILDCYREAIEKNYRFFSFGDSMFLK
ncbi:tRNA preQ1(34) S-adenosylmethionine ribosyltransferase-isomerase QueA [Acholeplasma hippikon]|uniref:S-adenosylmethionine:tRNA ribosyltransferase-isomerase n=1 Tax=Acholeplasma hippikon TaxID=264636 RepID=A0A449BJI5_9MOLU|nr:tRNA preQ1(34) S-adenosylmethionine ribosyltransferase-isomerase QueA [Acholeplasma hippikon]VEU82625.1 S-adenosylmethionine:tRNA ribosyltransferase-isomerase [Acholeplasma hippikon]